MGTQSIKQHFGLIGYNQTNVNKIATMLSPLIATKAVDSPERLMQMDKFIGAVGYVMDNQSTSHMYNLKEIRDRFTDKSRYLFTSHVSITLLHQALRLGIKDVFMMPCDQKTLGSLLKDIRENTNIECFEVDIKPGDFIPPPEEVMSHPLTDLFELLEFNFIKKPSLQTVSNSLHLSPSRISHMFKDLCGIGYSHYILCRRLEESEYLLVQENASITTIAFHLGFANPSHFCRSFKEHIGITPTAYMKSEAHTELSCLYQRYQRLRMELLPALNIETSHRKRCVN